MHRARCSWSLLMRNTPQPIFGLMALSEEKPSAFKNAAVAKLARRGRLKICYIRNVVGSNPTCGTILFNMSHSSNQNKGKTALRNDVVYVTKLERFACSSFSNEASDYVWVLIEIASDCKNWVIWQELSAVSPEIPKRRGWESHQRPQFHLYCLLFTVIHKSFIIYFVVSVMRHLTLW